MIENENHWVFPIEGRTVTELRIGYNGLELHFLGTDEEAFRLFLSCPFYFRGPDRVAHLLDPYASPPLLAPALATYQSVVQRAVGYKYGGLEVHFTDGSTITSEPCGFEAWEFRSDNGILVVPAAGGGYIAVWEEL